MQLSIATLFALATALSASAVVPPRPTGTPAGSGAVQFKTLLEGGAAIPFYHDANRAGHVGETDWKDLFFTPSDQDLDTWFVNTRGNATKTYVGKVGFIPMVDANKPGPKCKLERKTNDLKKVHYFYFKHGISYLWPCFLQDKPADFEENQAFVTCVEEEAKCTAWDNFKEPLISDLPTN